MEAYLKTIGTGLYFGFPQVEKCSCFQRNFYEVTVPEEYVGVVAYKTPFCLAKASLEHPILIIKTAINIDIPPSTIGIL
jgi:hypothetical protein